MRAGAIMEALYAELVEPATLRPTFYIDFPAETSPLTGPTARGRTRRAVGPRRRRMEVGTAYTELTDPVDQRAPPHRAVAEGRCR